MNQTGKPEAVLTSAQWEAVGALPNELKTTLDRLANALDNGVAVDLDNGQLFFDAHYSPHQRRLALDSHLAGRR